MKEIIQISKSKQKKNLNLVYTILFYYFIQTFRVNCAWMLIKTPLFFALLSID